jgi:hypothetical protein
MIKKNLLQLCVALCALQASAAMALTVWDNGGPSTAAGAGEGGSNLSEFKQAEDFTLSFASNLTSVTFWSLEASAADYSGNIFYEITNNLAGVPGATVFGSGLAATTRTAAGSAAGLNQFKNDFALSVNNLAAGTYWITLHNGPMANSGFTDFYWSWADLNATNSGAGTFRGQELSLPATPATPWTTNSQEHAFLIAADLVPEVPEPETWMLLSAGLLGLAWRTRLSASRKA